MQKLIFIRYGEWENGHLTEQGKATMASVADRLSPVVQKHTCFAITANVPRALESAGIVTEKLGLPPAKPFAEFYAEEEHQLLPNTEKAAEIIAGQGKMCDVLIVIPSREYINLLPSYILSGLGAVTTEMPSVQRGEILVLDVKEKNLRYL